MAAKSIDGEDRLGRVQSLVRAFGVLDALCESEGMTLSEVARQVELPRSTTHRLLTTMEALGYVRFERGSNRWSVGVQAFTVGSAFAQTKSLGELGQSFIRSLVLDVKHSVNISVREPKGMCYLNQAVARESAKTSARPGACLPMHTTAAGKAVMACWTERELDQFLVSRPLSSRTRHTLASPAALRAELACIRDRGYAVDDEEQELGLRCVGAVVTDRLGNPRGALSISDSALKLGRNRFIEVGPMLAAAARQMSSQIACNLT